MNLLLLRMLSKPFLALTGLLILAPATAQIYKSVGSDGKVHYTNVIPQKKEGPVTLVQPPAVKGAVLSASLAATSPAVSVQPLARPRPAAVRVASGRKDVDAGGRILTPDVISAVSNVMDVAQLVSSSREFCVAAQPRAQQRYSSAAEGWGVRNSAVVAQKNRVLSHPVQQMIAEALNADMVRKTASLMQPVRQASSADRIQWCDKAFADVNRGVLDLVGRPSIAPLMNFGRR